MQGLIDTTLKHYRIQRRLARGGMSEVYLAEDTRSSQVVALKIVSRDVEDYAERFRREVRTIASLHHDHILPALDYGEYRSWFYLVTPYVAHGTLREYLSKGPLPLKEAGLFLEQIASALQYAHERGILHRDIKAPNVLLRDKDYTYLADFGLVKSIQDEYSLTRTGFLVGTPEYMAPELVEYQATAQSDIYALGIVLYEMLTGDLPFKGNTPVAVVMKHLREAPVPPSHLNPLIPSALEDVILRALDKDPRRRFQNAGDFAQAYRQALEEEAKTETVQVTALASAPTMQNPTPPSVIDYGIADIATVAPLLPPPPPPPFGPVQITVRPVYRSPAQAFSPARLSKHHVPRWMWPVLAVSLVLLLIAMILLASVFSSMRQPSLPKEQTPIVTPTSHTTPAATSQSGGSAGQTNSNDNSQNHRGNGKKHGAGD